MPDHAEEDTDGVAREIEEFLNKWTSLPDEEEGESCPPDYILLAVSKERDTSIWTKIIQQAAAVDDNKQLPPESHDKWYTHLQQCDSCKQIIGLLQHTPPRAITMGQLLAQASMEAQKQKAAARRAGRFKRDFGGLFSPNYPAGRGNSLGRTLWQAAPIALTAVLVFAFWGAGSYLNFFKQPGGRAEVSFKRNEPEILARALKDKLEQLKKEGVSKELSIAEYNQQMKEYNDKLREYLRLKEQKLLSETDRGLLASQLALYQEEMRQLQASVPSHKRAPVESQIAMTTASAQSSKDPKDAREILKYVGQELIKKTASDNHQSDLTISEVDAVRSGFDNVELKFSNVADDLTKIEVVDKQGASRPQEEIQMIRRGLQQEGLQQGFAERMDGRKVELLFQGATVRVFEPSVAGAP